MKRAELDEYLVCILDENPDASDREEIRNADPG